MNKQTTDFMDFQQELLETTREAIEKSYQIALTGKSKHDECVKYFSNESEN